MFRNLSTDALGFWAPQNEQIELALSFGFKSIDIDMVDFSEQVQSRGPEKSRRLIDSAKIKIGAFRLPLDLEADDATYRQKLEPLVNWATLAAQVGCGRALISVAPASEARPMHENFELHRARLSEIATTLAAQQIKLGVEFNALPHLREGKAHEFVQAFDTLLKLVTAVGRDNVGVVVDAWQMHVAGSGIDAVGSLPPDRIVYVKIADAPADVPRDQLKEENRLLPGTGGAIDLVGLVTLLTSMKYAGPITPVLHFGQFHGRRRDQAIRQIAQAMDEVWRGAGLPPALVVRAYSGYGAPPPTPIQQPPKEAEVPKEQVEEAAQPA
jgi:sugar phosphate isomerase/epimerase